MKNWEVFSEAINKVKWEFFQRRFSQRTKNM